MGADMILVVANAPAKEVTRADLEAKLSALTDEQVDNAIEWAHGAEFEDMQMGDEDRQAYAVRMLDEILDDEGHPLRYIGEYLIDGTWRWIAGGMSWGDTPEGYDGLLFLIETGVLTAPDANAPTEDK